MLTTEPSYYRYWGKAKRNGEDEGEAYHLLVYHSLDVAAVGYTLLQQHESLLQHLTQLTGMDTEDFKKWAVFFLSLHDLGKFADSFQALSPESQKTLQQRESTRSYSVRHDTLGFHLWKQVLRKEFESLKIIPPKKGKRPTTHPVADWIGAVTGHHGEPPKARLQGLPRDFFREPQDYEASKQFLADVHKLLCENQSFPPCDKAKIKHASWWLSGFAVLCDWLGSNKELFPYCSKETPLEKYWQHAKTNAKKAVTETGLLSAELTDTISLQQIINARKEEEIRPTPLQQTASKTPLSGSPHLFILEDVTGAGKTEAAVILAHRLMQKTHAKGVYFALPTMATSNAMYSRMAIAYQHFYKSDGNKPSLILAHAASKMSDEFRESLLPKNPHPKQNNGDDTTTAEAHCNQWLADNRKKSLLADIGVGTIDQALLAILPSKHQSLRLLGLLNKVLIVDEVHACDAYMLELLCALLRAHASAGGSSILLSATLPENQRQQLLNACSEGQQWQTPELKKTGEDSYPLVTALNNLGLQETIIETRDTVKRTVKVKLLDHKKEVENLLIQTVKNGQCACWIRNTVIDARESYEYLKKAHPDWKIDLFHARFALGDRLDIEKRVLKRFGKNSTTDERKKQILIATQVVEQSLDADWDELITDLTPIDLIIQRAGRLRRHIRDASGNRTEGKDQRGQPVLHILSPEPVATPPKDWYSNFFKIAKNIYENHGQLWLTAHLLQQAGKFKMPEDARTLIEGVYSDEAQENIPNELLDSAWDAEGSSKAETSIARLNALRLTTGYASEVANHWWDEAKTPTRLGEETITLYLAKWANGKLKPWRDEKQFAWSYSSVSVRTYWVNKELSTAEIPLDDIEAYKQKLPAKGKWGVLVVLKETETGIWQGHALNEAEEKVTVLYTATSGLEVK